MGHVWCYLKRSEREISKSPNRPLALCLDRSSDGCSPLCFRVWRFWWASVLVVSVCCGRFHDLTLRLGCGACERIVALLCPLSWVAVREMLVCECPASQGGILQAISPAGRRGRASAPVNGRKITMYMHACAPFTVLSLFVTHDFYRVSLTGFPTS